MVDPVVAPPRARLGPVAEPVREVDIDGCVSLYRRGHDSVLVLNETASDVWRLTDGSLDDVEIVEVLARAYGVEPAVIEADVQATIARLVHEGFVSVDLR